MISPNKISVYIKDNISWHCVFCVMRKWRQLTFEVNNLLLLTTKCFSANCMIPRNESMHYAEKNYKGLLLQGPPHYVSLGPSIYRVRATHNLFTGRNHITPPKLKVGVEIENFYDYWEFKKSDESWEWIIIMIFTQTWRVLHF